MIIRRLAVGLVMGLLTLGAAAAGPEPEAGFDLAGSLIDAEQYEKAVAVLKQLNAGDAATQARIDLLFGRIYLAINKPTKSLEFFEHAAFASLDVEAEATLGLAEARLTLGELAEARRLAAMALKSDPDLVAAQLVMALADQRVGRAEAALSRLRQLQGNQPSSEEVAVVLARFLARQTGPEAGMADLQRFIGDHPAAAGAWDAYGQMLWAAGKKAEGVDARMIAKRLYGERGQGGRSEAMAAWLAAVDPQGRLQGLAAKTEARQKQLPPDPQKDPTQETSKEPPAPTAAPRPAVKAMPLAATLPHPEPLPFAPGSPIMTGSGIVLEGGRLIITNRHTVEGQAAIAVRNGTGYVRKARLVKLSDDDDLALLEIDRPFPEGAAMPLAGIVEPATGRAAIVLGYPIISLFGDEQPSLTDGIVAKTTGLGDAPGVFQITAKLNKGTSGGPIFDKRGHLIGVAVGKVDTAGIYQKTGTLVEDINLGISGGRILRFLGKAPAEPTAPPEMSLEDLYRQMLPRAVLIAAQK